MILDTDEQTACARTARTYNALPTSNAREPVTVDTATRKRLRQIAHHLHPIVIVGEAGVSAAVITETDRALNDHELIKVKVAAEDREDRKTLGDALADACRAELIQRIGKVLVLYRRNPEPRADLSNVQRAGGLRTPRG